MIDNQKFPDPIQLALLDTHLMKNLLMQKLASLLKEKAEGKINFIKDAKV